MIRVPIKRIANTIITPVILNVLKVLSTNVSFSVFFTAKVESGIMPSQPNIVRLRFPGSFSVARRIRRHWARTSSGHSASRRSDDLHRSPTGHPSGSKSQSFHPRTTRGLDSIPPSTPRSARSGPQSILQPVDSIPHKRLVEHSDSSFQFPLRQRFYVYSSQSTFR